MNSIMTVPEVDPPVASPASRLTPTSTEARGAASKGSRAGPQSDTPILPPPDDHVEVSPHSAEAHILVEPDSHETYVQVVDPQTDTVIQEVPAEKVRQLSASLAKIVGQELDRRA